MSTTNILVSTLSAWFTAFVYDFIENTTGVEIRVLPYVAMIIMVAGLYFGLRNDKKTEKGEV